MKFIVDRKKWLRGEGTQHSALLRSSDGLMCCVGQFCLQLGAPREEIEDLATVKQLTDCQTKVPQLCKPSGWEDGWVADAYEVNDDEGIDDEERERLLKDLALRGGHEIEFVN